MFKNDTVIGEGFVEFVVGKDSDGDDIYEEIRVELKVSCVGASGDGWNDPREDAHVEDVNVVAVYREDGASVDKNDPIWNLAETWAESDQAYQKMIDAMVDYFDHLKDEAAEHRRGDY